MPFPLTDEQLAALRELDTPTICNAIERFNVRGRVEGFLGMDIRCLLPELGSMVGYAVTAAVDSTTPGPNKMRGPGERGWKRWPLRPSQLCWCFRMWGRSRTNRPILAR